LEVKFITSYLPYLIFYKVGNRLLIFSILLQYSLNLWDGGGGEVAQWDITPSPAVCKHHKAGFISWATAALTEF
jgi:hypothetical protein